MITPEIGCQNNSTSFNALLCFVHLNMLAETETSIRFVPR